MVPLIETGCEASSIPVYRQDIIGLDGCIMRPSLGHLALPRFSSVTYTLAYGASLRGRVGTSPVKLTNHFLEVKPSDTVAFDRQLTV